MTLLLQGAGVQTIAGGSSVALLLDLEADTGVTTDDTPFSGTGMITQSGTTVTGIGTLFGPEVVIGDRITASGIDGLVQSIPQNTSLTLNTSASVAIGVSFTISPQSNTVRVSAWADQSGKGNDFQASGTVRPFFQIVDGAPAVSFDSFNDYMESGNFADNLSEFTIIGVTARTVDGMGGNDYQFIGKIDNYLSGQGWSAINADNLIIQEDGGSVYMQWGIVGGLPGYSEKFILSVVKASNSQVRIFKNGVDLTVLQYDFGPVGTFTNNLNVRIGSMSDGQGSIGDRVRAIRIYDIALPDAARASIEMELAARYGITL